MSTLPRIKPVRRFPREATASSHQAREQVAARWLPRFDLRLALLAICLLLAPLVGAAVQSPQELIQDTANQMVAKLKQEKSTLKAQPDRVYELVNSIVVPHFDFELMAKRVLGKHWRDATPQQRQQFVEAFRGVLVRTYANRLTEYTDYQINYIPAPPEPEPDRALVRSEVALPGQMPVQIDYRLRMQNNEWKVYDVTIEGVSLVTNYRSSFNTEIAQGGLDQLIERLKAPAEVRP